MEYQQKMLLLAALLIAVALYLAYTSGPLIAPSSAEAEGLLQTSAGFGKGLAGYTYSYSDVSDGYKTAYTLIDGNGSREITIVNPLSTKKVYLLQNDTIFCIAYPVNETCASVMNDTLMQNYVAFVQSKFFNDTNIANADAGMRELIKKGYLQANWQIANKSVGGYACREVAYSIDYSNATVDDAARFGIGMQSPKQYNLTRCIGENGMAYETTLAYADRNMTHVKITTVSAFGKDGAQISPPEDLSGNPVKVFSMEREQQVVLARCHTDMTGEAREECVADVALSMKRKDICELAGTRRDRCMVSIVPLTKDTAICSAIADASFKDDCFIELAGAYKNSTYCANLLNSSKMEFCQNAAKPSVQNATKGNSSINIQDLIEQVDKSGAADNSSGKK